MNELAPTVFSENAALAGKRLLMVAHSNSAHTGRWAKYFQHQGMIVRVLSPVDKPIAGVDVTPFPSKRKWYHKLKGLHLYLDYPRWRAIFRDFRPDITHVHYPDGGGRNRFYFNRVHPLVTSTWGSEVVESPEFPLSVKHKNGVRQILGRSQVVTATTRFLADVTARYCAPGTPIHIIPFGVDCDLFRPDRASPAGAASNARAGHAEGQVTLGFFKNLERKYGPEVLIEAFAAVARQCPGVRLLMCGEGPMGPVLRERVKELGLSQKVEFPGRLPHEQVVAAMRGIDLLVMPSTCQESFGVAAIEASACEVPVVATRVGGVPEAVVDGETGLLVPPFDAAALAEACVGLIRDPERRLRLGAAGRRFVLDHYQWHANAAAMASVYAQILGGGGVKTPNMIVAS